MDAPKPNPITESKEEISLKKEYKYTLNEKDYLIQIGKINSDKLLIKIRELSSISNVFYENNFTLEKLQKLSKIFRYYDNIDETIENLYDIFEEKNYSIKIENNKLFLIIKLNKGIKGDENINIELFSKNFSLQNIVNNLCDEINSLKNKINNLQEKNKEFENEINFLSKKKKKKDEIIEKIDKWKNDIEKKEKEKKNRKNKIDSKIITKKEEIELLSNRIKKTGILKNKKISYKLIFRATRDGTLSTNFHQKCDGIGPTISIIQTNKGYKFGGYAEKPWNKSGGWIIDDENAFVFSLDHMKIYNAVKGSYKYYFGESYGPSFYSFWPRNDMFATSGNYVLKKDEANKYFFGFNSDYELNGGENEFVSIELEVFQIVLE